jgi:hypothetical protein
MQAHVMLLSAAWAHSHGSPQQQASSASRDRPSHAPNAPPCPNTGQDREQRMRSALQGDLPPCGPHCATPAASWLRPRCAHTCTRMDPTRMHMQHTAHSTQPKRLNVDVRCGQRGTKRCAPNTSHGNARGQAGLLSVTHPQPLSQLRICMCAGTPLPAASSCPLTGCAGHDSTLL